MRAPFRLRNLCLFAVVVVTVLAANLARAQAGACVSGPCIPTYHNDPMRDGVNPQETTLTPSLFPTKNSSNFGKLVPSAGGASGAVDGLIYAQPLYLSGVTMATASCSGSQNIVLVATENNSVYAFTWTYTLTAKSYTFTLTQCWTLNFNQAGEYAIPYTALPVSNGTICDNLTPQIGITSTPVVDTSVTPPMLYVVSAHQTASLSYTNRLHAVNVSTGVEITNGTAAPYNLSGVFAPGLAANQQNQRAGLALFDPSPGLANIYIGWGSFCDTFPYSGYLAGLTYSYSTQSFSPVGPDWVFDTESGQTGQGGGIWMGGAAPAVDSVGNVYLAVANGDWNGATIFGQSVVKLATTSTGLVPVDYYTPNDYADLNSVNANTTLCSSYGPSSCPSTNLLTLPKYAGDYDLGAAGVVLISPAGVTTPPCGSNNELIAGGKEGVLYGVCYSSESDGALESVMGGLDGCGYDCTSTSNPSITACTENSPPTPGSIAQCFQGVNVGEDQSNGSDNIFATPGIRGTEAFWAGTASAPENYLYVSGASSALIAYQANTATGAFNTVGAPSSYPLAYPYPGTTPALSWDGADSDTALLWAIDSAGFGLWHPLTSVSQAAKPAILVVYNPIPSGTTPELQALWESSAKAANAGPGAVKFTVPTIAGGLVFVPGGTPGYAPGPPGGKNVNCTASFLANSTTPTVCGGQLAVYGKIHS